MPKTNLRTLWNRNKPVLNGWLQIDCPLTAEIMSRQDYDSITIDMQHGIIGYTGSVSMLQSMHSSGVTPIVRVPWLDPSPIMKALDAGAYGIICPMINNPKQAEEFVSYMRYPPLGQRSFGPTRALYSSGNAYWEDANSKILSLAMIETKEAFQNINSIVNTKGLSGVYIGPSDLGIGLSDGDLGPGMDRTEAEVIDAFNEILNEAKKANILSGIHCASPEYAAKAVKWGFDLVTVNSDVKLLSEMANHVVKKTRNLF